jgi:hypothetical protein
MRQAGHQRQAMDKKPGCAGVVDDAPGYGQKAWLRWRGRRCARLWTKSLAAPAWLLLRQAGHQLAAIGAAIESERLF